MALAIESRGSKHDKHDDNAPQHKQRQQLKQQQNNSINSEAEYHSPGHKMKNETPFTPFIKAVNTAETGSPTSSEDSIVDPPDYIAPDQQDMMLSDITSEILHSHKCTVSIGRGNHYLSAATHFPQTWPASGVVYGYNKRLMISLPCRRGRPDRGYRVLNVFFLVDTSSPCSYLCQEAMTALIGNPTSPVPEQLTVVVNEESFRMAFHLSPLGTLEEPGKFHDVNVLGMDFLQLAGLCMTVNTPIQLFRLFKEDDNIMYRDYPDEE